MAASRTLHILTINSGSSSLKFAHYDMGKVETRRWAGSIERIGLEGSTFEVGDGGGAAPVKRRLDLPDYPAALRALFSWLQEDTPGQEVDAVGHRIVHGGPHHREPQRITGELIAALQELVPLAPDHLPHELAAIRALAGLYPKLPQVACFDTAFHRTMPELAQLYALPWELHRQGVIRYGFHGLSYEYIVQELRQLAGEQAVAGRVIIAHLGNGASMAAVREGHSVDTTMGFTPAGGLVMSTRSGDLDPGVLVYLLRDKGLSPSALNDLVNKQAGLLGVSGTSSDMKALLDQEAEDRRAAAAVALFCYQAKKYLAALAAVLGGLDTLVFTAGIGENAPAVRRRICQGLEFLGLRLDPQQNTANAAIISAGDSRVTVRVIPTDEDLMIARHTARLISTAAE